MSAQGYRYLDGIRGWSVYYKQYLLDEDGVERGAKPYSVLDGPYTQEGTAEIDALFGNGKVFSFPKPSSLVQHLLSYGSKAEDAIIIDFFAGSGPTAQAVLQMNLSLKGHRRFILVQLPEPTPPESPARKAGYSTIAEICKDRIRRFVEETKASKGKQMELSEPGHSPDLGFRVFKLQESRFKQWAGVSDKQPATYADQMELYRDPLIPGWQVEDVIWEVAVKQGYGLDSRIAKDKTVNGNTVWRVVDDERGQSFRVCLDDKLTAATVKELDLKEDDLFVCRDSAIDDSAAANLALQCELRTI